MTDFTYLKWEPACNCRFNISRILDDFFDLLVTLPEVDEEQPDKTRVGRAMDVLKIRRRCCRRTLMTPMHVVFSLENTQLIDGTRTLEQADPCKRVMNSDVYYDLKFRELFEDTDYTSPEQLFIPNGEHQVVIGERIVGHGSNVSIVGNNAYVAG